MLFLLEKWKGDERMSKDYQKLDEFTLKINDIEYPLESFTGNKNDLVLVLLKDKAMNFGNKEYHVLIENAATQEQLINSVFYFKKGFYTTNPEGYLLYTMSLSKN